MDKFTRNCEWCSETFVTEYETKKYCNRAHLERAKRFRKSQNKINSTPQKKTGYHCVIFPRVCQSCHEPFVARLSYKNHCSDHCRAWHKQQANDERDRKYHNQKTPAFKRRIYFKTDGFCGVCGEWIDLREKYPSKKSMSIDHIVPRAKGGSHSFDNLQPAHLGCNESKGDRTQAPL